MINIDQSNYRIKMCYNYCKQFAVHKSYASNQSTSTPYVIIKYGLARKVYMIDYQIPMSR